MARPERAGARLNRMRLTALSLAAVITVLPALQPGVSAQPPSNGEAKPRPPLSTEGPGYSVERVRRELRQLPPTTTTERRDGLKLEYYIQVFGAAPKIDFFKNYDLKNGPVPFTAPTHADMLEQMTPQQYRHPVADIPSLLMWIGQQLSKKKK